MYGIQFHPEVTHTPQGRVILRNFVLGICGAKADWEMGSFVNEAIARIREEVGEEGHVIGAVSGGVDSSVAAVLLNRAIGKRFHAMLVDNGVLRLDEVISVLLWSIFMLILLNWDSHEYIWRFVECEIDKE